MDQTEQEKMCNITIDGEVRQIKAGTRLQTLAREAQDNYPDEIVLAVYNHKLRELHHKVRSDGDITFLTVLDKNGRRAYRRSVVFLLQKAISEKYPQQTVDVRVMHSLGQGYYCCLQGVEPMTEEQLLQVKTRMMELVEEDIPLQKYAMKTQDAEELFHETGMEDKERLLRYRTSSNINIYELDGCKDYFYGYMVPSTGYLRYFDLQLFEQGFMLLFPNGDSRKVAEFKPAVKLFHILNESSQWSKTMEVPTVGALNDAIAAGKTRELILMQEALMEQKIGRLAENIAKDKDRKFVMIAGPSSSGKTTFSHRLSIQLRAQGLHPHPFPLDDYYLDRDKIPVDEYGKQDFECLESLDVKLFNHDMGELLQGKRVDLPVFNFKTGRREYKDKVMQLGKDDVLVIEGIHGLNDKLSHSIPKESKYKIYISALTQLSIDEHNPLPTTDGRLIRRIVRDSRTRSTSAQETIEMWDSVRRGEEKNIFPFQEMADEMFNSALIYELAVLKLYAQPQLFAIERDCEEYAEANRLLKLLDYFLPIPSDDIANNSILREFIGGSCFNV